MDDAERFEQYARLWSDRRSSIRTGNNSVESMQRLSSMTSFKQSTELYETRDTAAVLPALEELSSETYYQMRSPAEILIDKIELSRRTLRQCAKQFDAINAAYQRVSVEICQLGQQTLSLLKRVCVY